MLNGKLDDIDKRILTILQRQGRIEVEQLSRLVNLTRMPVSLRIDKLMEHGYIKGFAAIIDREKVGHPVLAVTHVKLDKQTTELLWEFEGLVCQMPEVQTCLHVSGDWNFILLITAETPQAYYTFLMEQIKSLPNMEKTDSSFVMKEAKNFGPLPLVNDSFIKPPQG